MKDRLIFNQKGQNESQCIFGYKILSNDIKIIKHVFAYKSLVYNNCTS